MRSTAMVLTALLGMVWSAALARAAPTPARDPWLSPDVLWRPREQMIFLLQDEQGDGFALHFTLRDMNTYIQGPRDIFFAVIGPNDEILLHQRVADDGVVSGDERYRDGIYDVGQDLRYRAYHRLFSPGGVPPHKQRSPCLDHPEQLAARAVTLPVPAAGKGLYRVFVHATWDTWLSIDASRDLTLGVHCGPGPFYVHQDRFADAYLYAPGNTVNVSFTLTEEIAPFNWQLKLFDETGAELARTPEARTFARNAVVKPLKPDAVYRLRVTGDTTGACLSFFGLPAVLCSTADSARRLRGGTQTDAQGRVTVFAFQRQLNQWIDNLKPEDLALPAELDAAHWQPTPALANAFRTNGIQMRGFTGKTTLADLLANQDLDPASPTYGHFVKADFDTLMTVVHLFGLAHADNPFHHQPALARRIVVRGFTEMTRSMPHFMWTPYGGEQPITTDNLPLMPGARHSWFGLGIEAYWIGQFIPYQEAYREVLGDDIWAGLLQGYRLWALARANVQVAEVSNQWAYLLRGMDIVQRLTHDQWIADDIRQQLQVMTTRGYFGRGEPDADPQIGRSRAGYGRSANVGRVGGGYLTDGSGWESEYQIEQESHIGAIFARYPEPGVLDWWKDYYVIKTHLSLPEHGVMTTDLLGEICSPTDFNHRTRYYTHKCGLPRDDENVKATVPYARLWMGQPAAGEVWPALETQPFLRSVDREFYFINTPGYYSVIYAGSAQAAWPYVAGLEAQDGHWDYTGFASGGYGAFGRKTTKAAGLSTVFVRGVGPVLLGSNQDVFYANEVWGRTKQPFARSTDPLAAVNIAEGYSTPFATFDEAGKVYTRTAELEFAPLVVRRVVHLGDERIDVEVTVTATAAVELAELYEAIPYVSEPRVITLYGADLQTASPFTPQPTLKYHGRPTPGQPLYAEYVNTTFAPEQQATFRAVDLSNEAGQGATLVFEQAHTFRLGRPFTYANPGPPVGSFNLPLPTAWRAGQSHTLRYQIRPHQQKITRVTE